MFRRTTSTTRCSGDSELISLEARVGRGPFLWANLPLHHGADTYPQAGPVRRGARRTRIDSIHRTSDRRDALVRSLRPERRTRACRNADRRWRADDRREASRSRKLPGDAPPLRVGCARFVPSSDRGWSHERAGTRGFRGRSPKGRCSRHLGERMVVLLPRRAGLRVARPGVVNRASGRAPSPPLVHPHQSRAALRDSDLECLQVGRLNRPISARTSKVCP